MTLKACRDRVFIMSDQTLFSPAAVTKNISDGQLRDKVRPWMVIMNNFIYIVISFRFQYFNVITEYMDIYLFKSPVSNI